MKKTRYEVYFDNDKKLSAMASNHFEACVHATSEMIQHGWSYNIVSSINTETGEVYTKTLELVQNN